MEIIIMDDWISGYGIIINLIGLFVMYEDKRRARKHLYRIPERTLFFVSLMGGSIGTWAGMYLFHHKTKHWYFVVGMPLILVIHLFYAYYLFH